MDGREASAGGATRGSTSVSPSLTAWPSSQRISLTVPASSASTGISIFIDSRITTVSPSSISSPTSHSIFHTVPVMWASTSATRPPVLLEGSTGTARTLAALPGRSRARGALRPPVGTASDRGSVGDAERPRTLLDVAMSTSGSGPHQPTVSSCDERPKASPLLPGVALTQSPRVQRSGRGPGDIRAGEGTAPTRVWTSARSLFVLVPGRRYLGRDRGDGALDVVAPPATSTRPTARRKAAWMSSGRPSWMSSMRSRQAV